jgi:soluble lytic murein transglycosylase
LCLSPGLSYKNSVKARVRRYWTAVALIAIAVALFMRWRWEEIRDHSQDKVILEAATRYGVDPALVKAVVWRESRFNPSAQGRAGEIGLMQVGELAAQEWADAENIQPFSHIELYDPRKNALAGTWYLKKMLKRYSDTDDPVPYALADYNAGRANVIRWNKDEAKTNSIAFIEHIGFPSTRDYVESVIIRYEHYQPIFPSRKTDSSAMTNAPGSSPNTNLTNAGLPSL